MFASLLNWKSLRMRSRRRLLLLGLQVWSKVLMSQEAEIFCPSVEDDILQFRGATLAEFAYAQSRFIGNCWVFRVGDHAEFFWMVFLWKKCDRKFLEVNIRLVKRFIYFQIVQEYLISESILGPKRRKTCLYWVGTGSDLRLRDLTWCIFCGFYIKRHNPRDRRKRVDSYAKYWALSRVESTCERRIRHGAQFDPSYISL